MSEGFTEPVVYVDETHAGMLYGVTENVPEQVRTLIEGLQAPTRLGRDVTWGEHFGMMDAVSVEVVWDEVTQLATYRVPGTQRRSVALSDLAEELDRDWERYLKDNVLISELLGRLDAITPAGIDTEEEMTTWFDPQARTVVADIDLAPVPAYGGLSTTGLRGRITVSPHAFDLDLEGDVPARQLSEADARLVLSDAVARANQEPVSVAFEEIWPYAEPFTEHGLEIDDPVVRPDGTVRVQVLTPAADAGGWLGGARAEQAVTFALNRDASGRDNGLVIRPGGSLTRELRDGALAADDERIVEWLSPDLAVDPGVREMTDAQAAATILGMRPEAFEAAAQGIEAGLRSAERELAHPTRSTAVFHMLNEQAARLKREVLHGVPESELSTSLDMERGRVWVRPKVMDSSHRPITVGANPEGQTFEVVDRRQVPNGQVGPWTDPQPLSDEQRAAGSRLVLEREATWDVDNAVLRDGEQSVATAWASMRLESSAGWWEPQEATALERWARAQAALTGGDAQVNVYEASAPGSGDADGRLIDMQGQGLDCRVSTARTLSGENQVQMADASSVQTLPVSELMDRVKNAWPDTTTQALNQRAEQVRPEQPAPTMAPVVHETDLREQARAAMRPALDRVERMVGEGRIIVDGPALEDVVSTSGVRSIAPSVVLRPADAPTNDDRAVLISLRDPHLPSTETVITPHEGAQNPYIPERVQAAADLGIQPQLFDAVRATIGDGLASAQYAATYPGKLAPTQGAVQGNAEVSSQARADEPELTVYTTPDCPGCQMTRRQLDKAGVAYEAVDLSGRPDLVAQFREEGLLQAPIIETSDGQRTAGFNPDRIKAIVAAATPQQAPGTTGPSDGGEGGSRPSRVPQQQRSRARGEGMHQ
ncbi:glutaredoxin domain-containing protein [Actinomyces oris]|jgi:nrdH family redoxin|uniref:glutaredoxin domain-containing protein n=1 Tax=Actinomyces oris TaxID=544580 RepID=UPI00352FC280